MKNHKKMPAEERQQSWDSDDYRRVVENSHDGMAMHSSRGHIVYINQRLLDMLGCSELEVVGMPLSRFLKPVTSKPVSEQLNRRKGSRGSIEVNLQRKDGRSIPALLSHTPFLDKTGEVKGEFIVVLDITERKRVEENRENLISNLTKLVTQSSKVDDHLSICSSCKKVRVGESTWQQIEEYIRQHFSMEFSHGICPSCISNLYPDIDLRNEE